MSRMQDRIRKTMGRHAVPALLVAAIGLISGIGLGYGVLAPIIFN